MRCDSTIGPKLSMLAKLKGRSQSELADECGISRISLNRFFRGHSEVKASDLVRLLNALGVDLLRDLELQFDQSLKGQSLAPPEPIYSDLVILISQFSVHVRRSILKQIEWWGRRCEDRHCKVSVHRLKMYLEGTQGKVT